MPAAFWEGALAGYGIAIPVGAIAILIVNLGLQRGFGPAFVAGAGASSADLVFATIAAVAGSALAATLAPFEGGLRLASALVLLAIGLYGFYQLCRAPRPESMPNNPARAGSQHSGVRLFGQFLGLTLLNPATIAYFAALIVSMDPERTNSWAARAAFVAGAALASLSWQTVLAGLSALGHRRLSPRFRTLTSILGNLIIIAFGVRAFLAG